MVISLTRFSHDNKECVTNHTKIPNQKEIVNDCQSVFGQSSSCDENKGLKNLTKETDEFSKSGAQQLDCFDSILGTDESDVFTKSRNTDYDFFMRQISCFMRKISCFMLHATNQLLQTALKRDLNKARMLQSKNNSQFWTRVGLKGLYVLTKKL